MIARDVAKQIIKENTGQEPNDVQITKAEMLIVAFANEYHKALQPTYSTKLSMPDVSGSFSAEDMEEAYNDGAGINKPREFDINNYR